MINLLPDETKRDLGAARSNVILLRYNFLTLAAAGGLLLICLFFYVVLNANQSNAAVQSKENEAKTAAYAQTQADASEYQKNLATAKSILDRNVDYTSTIFEIVKLLPAGVILDGVTLKAADFGKQMTFTANAKSYDHANQLKLNFQNSKIFTNVHFQNVSNQTSADAQNSPYPVQVTLSVQLNKVAP